MIRIGLLSSAHMHLSAYVHALQALPEVEIVGIYDDDAARGKAFALTHAIPWQANLDPLLATVDATIICAENARHRFYVEASAAAKRPMLCEKPLATNLDDALVMLESARVAAVPLYMALPVRFAPGFGQALQAVHQGHIGRVLAMVGTNHGYLPPGWFLQVESSGGGAVMDHTPHVADLMRLMARSEVDEVFAEIDARARRAGIDDSAILTFTFTNGVFATLDPSWSRNEGYPTWGDVTLEVVGTDGVIAFDPLRSHLNLYRGRMPSHQELPFGENMDIHLVQAFVDALLLGRAHPMLAQGLDGLRVLEIALAAYRSQTSHHPERIERMLEP